MWRLNVALLRAAGRMYRENAQVLLPLLQVAARLPRTSRKKRAFLPSRSGGAASAEGGLAPAMHAPPPLSMRDPHAREGKGSPRTECRVPQRAGQRAAHLAMRRASASMAANTGAEGALSPCCHMLSRLGPLFALVRVGGRIKRPTGRGGMAVRPRTPRGTAMSLDPCLQCTVASARRERSSAIETKGLATKASV